MRSVGARVPSRRWATAPQPAQPAPRPCWRHQHCLAQQIARRAAVASGACGEPFRSSCPSTPQQLSPQPPLAPARAAGLAAGRSRQQGRLAAAAASEQAALGSGQAGDFIPATQDEDTIAAIVTGAPAWLAPAAAAAAADNDAAADDDDDGWLLRHASLSFPCWSNQPCFPSPLPCRPGPTTQGSVAIIRVSGSDATQVAARLFRPGGKFQFNWQPESHRVYYGKAVDADEAFIDEVSAGRGRGSPPVLPPPPPPLLCESASPRGAACARPPSSPSPSPHRCC
jgi:hypothetical protein